MAVRLMEKGRHEEAYHLLRRSCGSLQNKLATSRKLRYSSQGSFRHESQPSFCGTLTHGWKMSPARLFSVPVHTGKARSVFIQTQENIFSVYAKAFEIETVGIADEEETSLASIFVVLAYNMGLALFIGSTLSGSRVLPSQIQHNIRVFEAAMRAMNGIQQQQGMGLLHVVLALTFNLGYLHNLNYSFQETRDHLSRALELISCPRIEESVSREDYDFFYSSMCMFTDRGMELHLAPAA